MPSSPLFDATKPSDTVEYRISAALGRLAHHLPPSFALNPQSDADSIAKHDAIIADYVEDLAPYGADAVEEACRHWRRHGKPFFPTISNLIAIIEKHRAADAARNPDAQPKVATLRVSADARTAFEPVRAVLAQKLGRPAVMSWFLDVGLQSFLDGRAILVFPTRFRADYVHNTYHFEIVEALAQARGACTDIEYTALADTTPRAQRRG